MWISFSVSPSSRRADGDARPAGDDRGDVVLVDLLLHHRLELLLLALGQLGLERRQLAVADLGDPLEVAGALDALGLHAQVVDPLRDLLDAVELLLLLRPAGGELVAVRLRVGELALDRLAHVLGLLAHGGELDLELAHAALGLVQLERRGVDLHAQARGGLVHEVDRLVGEEAVGDVAVGEHGRGDERRIADADAVVGFVALLRARGGSRSCRRRTARRRSTGWKRRSRAASFSTCLRYSSRVVAPTARSSPRASIGLSMLAASTAPSAAPAPTIVCSSSMKRMISPADSVISLSTAFSRSSNSPRYFEPARSAPMSSAHTRLPLRPSGTSPATMRWASPSAMAVLPTPGIADQDRVVLRATREHLDDAADLLVAPDHRVELALLGQLREVAPELLQRLVRAFGVLGGDALGAAHVLERGEERVAGNERRARAGGARWRRTRPRACASPARRCRAPRRTPSRRAAAAPPRPARPASRRVRPRRGRARPRRTSPLARRASAGAPDRAARAAGARGRSRGCRSGGPAPARRRPPPAT